MRTKTNVNLLLNYLKQREASLLHEINHEPKNQLLNVNEDVYIDYLVNKYSIELLALHCEKGEISHHEQLLMPSFTIPSHGIHTFPQEISSQTITYHAPFSGNPELMQYQPMSSIRASLPRYKIDNGELFFMVNCQLNNGEQAKDTIYRYRDYFVTEIANINNDLNTYNSSLRHKVELLLKNRKEQLLQQSQLIKSIGIPLRATGQDHQKKVIIPLQKKSIVIKPQSSNAAYIPEPTIDDAIYQDILKMCHTLGVNMERHPSLYRNNDGKIKCEESLRDIFLALLALQFESVTGETFNKSGKTDILIRYEGKNAFVAEFKFWRGAQVHKETIDQLLSYLTWRDSKSAILYFVNNKNLKAVLDQISELTSQHSCFVNSQKTIENSWFNFQFHLLEDKSKNVKLAILLFHFTEDIA